MEIPSIIKCFQNFRCLPMRLFLNDSKLKIQRGIKIEKNQEKKTIGEIFKELFPELFEIGSKSSNLLKQTKVFFNYQNF